ncbi:MAG TPA: YggS family pyridoxal phosphate-dependent enzyme [Candidatus Limnocylindrales bacterium]|nr:YggS family pyridoxal phosphate-dependent enzyme [Candidatus Limnocylindrales bacterium]
MSLIAENVARVRGGLAQACEQSGRDPADVRLIAVSKTHPASAVCEAIEAGVRDFGENRVEEAVGKIAEVAALRGDAAIMWHMIGHIQSRKARDAAPLFQAVHSVDGLKLAAKLAQAIPGDERLRVLLECNVSGETSKGGFDMAGWQTDSARLEQLAAVLRVMCDLTSLEVCGLMTMAPIAADMEQTRPVFQSLRRLRDALEQQTGQPLPELSMGMTDDFPIALAEGATMVRVGRAVFGERNL